MDLLCAVPLCLKDFQFSAVYRLRLDFNLQNIQSTWKIIE